MQNCTIQGKDAQSTAPSCYRQANHIEFCTQNSFQKLQHKIANFFITSLFLHFIDRKIMKIVKDKTTERPQPETIYHIISINGKKYIYKSSPLVAIVVATVLHPGSKTILIIERFPIIHCLYLDCS